MQIYMLMDGYFSIGNCITFAPHQMNALGLHPGVYSVTVFSCWVGVSVGEDRVLKQALFFWSSSWMIVLGVVLASVACSMLGVVAGRIC